MTYGEEIRLKIFAFWVILMIANYSVLSGETQDFAMVSHTFICIVLAAIL